MLLIKTSWREMWSERLWAPFTRVMNFTGFRIFSTFLLSTEVNNWKAVKGSCIFQLMETLCASFAGFIEIFQFSVYITVKGAHWIKKHTYYRKCEIIVIVFISTNIFGDWQKVFSCTTNRIINNKLLNYLKLMVLCWLF